MAYQRGFTLVELVMTIVIIGILAITVVPRFANTNTFSASGYFEAARAAMAYARSTAVAQRRNVCVTVAPAGLTFTRATTPGGACTVPLIIPQAGGGGNVLGVPGGVVISGYVGAFTFQPSGTSTATFGLTIGSSGSSENDRTFIVSTDGYVD